MINSHAKKNLPGQRALLAASLTVALTAFGCTTDRHLGNGDPVVTPGLRTTPTSSPTTGSETQPSTPMFSSSRFADTSIRNGAPAASSPAGAAAIMAEHQPSVRVLGRAADGATPPAYYSGRQVTGQFQNPAVATNPQSTVNSSISSQPVSVIASGAGGSGGGAVGGAVVVGGGGVAGGVVAPTVTSGLAIGGNVTDATAAPVVAPSTLSPTAAGIALPAGAFAARTFSPTASSVVTPPASVSATPGVAALATRSTNLASGTAATRSSTVTNTATASRQTTAASTATARTATTANGNVRILTSANGRPLLTNTTSGQ